MDRLATQRHASPCNHEATLQRNIRVERVKNRRSRPRGEMNFLCNARLYATHVAATPCLHVVTLLRVRKVAARSTIHDSPRNRRRHPTQDSTRNDVSSQVENSWGRKKKKRRKQKRRKKKENVKACKRCNSIPWWLGNNLKIAYACGKLLSRENCISLTRSLFTSQMSVARIFGFFAN